MMIKNIRKYLEYLFFIVVNICLLIPVYGFILLCFSGFAYFIASDIFHVSEDIIIQDDPTFIIWFAAFSLSLVILKPIIFQILYICNKKFPFIHNFFDRFRTKKNFLILILCLAFFIDFLCFIKTNNIFSLFFGLLFNYLTFLLFFHFYKKNIENQSKINTKDKISKIISLSFIGITLIIFILIILFFLFCYLINIII